MHSAQGSDEFDVVIIGAGLYGIQAARCYLEIYPKRRVTILESDSVIGGTWSSKRIYDAFWTQTPTGMAEFSDRPMTLPPENDQFYGFFPAKYVTEYLESYVDDHVYGGSTLRERIVFNAYVKHVEKLNGKWIVELGEGKHTLRSAKLIDATGMTSQPYIPKVHGQELFGGLVLHHKDFGQSIFLENPKFQTVSVLGGAKSAADVAYAAAKAGKTVSWIIREEGSGPAALLSAQGKPPYKNSNEGFYNRFIACFLPNPFTKPNLLKLFLHSTRLGTWLIKRMWDNIDKGNRASVMYDRKEGQAMGFANLEPDTPLFWQNDSSGVNQHEDFFKTIAKQVHVYRQSIDHLTCDSVVLAPRASDRGKTKRSIPTDVLVYCTGWESDSALVTTVNGKSLGLPIPIPGQDAACESRWKALEDESDKAILARFRSIAQPPDYRRMKPSRTPFRLFKSMVPIADEPNRSLIFLGRIVVGNNFRAAEAQALWAVSYLEGFLPLAEAGEKKAGRRDAVRRMMEEDVAEKVAWCRRRYLNKGETGAWFYFDVVDYTDMLLAQLGLTTHRKKGWWGNLYSPCTAQDLKDLVSEFKNRYEV